MKDLTVIGELLRVSGYATLPGQEVLSLLCPNIADWSAFADSWDDLAVDTHMADGGRYRRRRYAVFDVKGEEIVRGAHQPHFQAKIYNRLNGDLQRWFEPVSQEVGASAILQRLFVVLASVFDAQTSEVSAPKDWHVEVHQFRIEATAANQGQPTPEGVHRDGVDFAFVMMIDRKNVASGVTEIFDPAKSPLGSFTLTAPGDAVILDDHRVLHGVTPIVPLDHAYLAVRDVLVVTFTRKPTPG